MFGRPLRMDVFGALLDAVNDPAAGGVVGRDRDPDPIAQHDSDAVLPHLSCEVGKDFEARVEPDLEEPAREHLYNCTFEFYVVFATHKRA